MNSTSNELLHYRFRVMKYIQYILIIRVILRVIRDILLNGIADINIKRDMHRPNPDETSYWCDNFVEYRDCTKFQSINIHICPISLSSKGKKVLLMDHVKTMPGPLVPSTNPELITGLIAKRYYLFFERNPEDGIANPAHAVTPARKRTAKASKEVNKVGQAKSGGPGQISFSSSSLPILSHISIISRSSIKASVQQGWMKTCSTHSPSQIQPTHSIG